MQPIKIQGIEVNENVCNDVLKSLDALVKASIKKDNIQMVSSLYAAIQIVRFYKELIK